MERNLPLFPPYAMTLFLITAVMFTIRDSLTGSLRFFFQIYHVGFLWFVPDVMSSLSAIVILIWLAMQRNIYFYILALMLVGSALVGALFMNLNAGLVFSAAKAVTPFFVGLGFAGYNLTDNKTYRLIIFVMTGASIIGMLANPYITYPWTGQTINTFGIERQATKLWWQGGKVRYGGLAGDSTMAAFMFIFGYFLLARHMKWYFHPPIIALIVWAIDISTSRTANVGLAVFLMSVFLLRVFPKRDMLKTAQRIGMASFIAVIIPILMVFLLSGAGMDKISANLFSMQDRIDHGWQGPFQFLSLHAPITLLTGCGLGCFSYTMGYSEMAWANVPIDNFYINSYLMMGIPFALFVILSFSKIRNYTDVSKLLIIAAINGYSMTISCYGPSFATMMMGYAYSDALLPFAKSFRWRRNTALHRENPAIA